MWPPSIRAVTRGSRSIHQTRADEHIVPHSSTHHVQDRGSMAGEELDLAAALEALRAELESVWRSSHGHDVRFRTSDVTLRVQTVARFDREGSGKIRWYLLEAGGGVTSGSERTQELTLALTPFIYDDEDNPVPLDVGGKQAAPGQ